MSAIQLVENVKKNIGKVIVGKEAQAEEMLLALVCGGHVLIEDVPGLGKTTLVTALARSLNCTYSRIQFTSDLLPSDVTGYTAFNPKTGEREVCFGGLMAQIVLADEINRTSPKTQSSLLEAMQEAQLTIDGKTYPLPSPFIVLATQNPVEHTGTYPLPEAQLDRFFMRVSIGYPSPEEEIGMLNMYMERDRLVDELEPVCTCEDLIRLQGKVGEVRVSREMRSYIVSIAQASRQGKVFERGISPRGAIALMRSAQAAALLDGREYVMPEDVRKMAAPVLSHRVVLSPEFRLGPKAITPEKALARLIAAVQVPVRVK
jgi:MoxR-like ATPase